MARTVALTLKEVRVPTPRLRAQKIIDHIALSGEGNGPRSEYEAAGAIDLGDGIAELAATSVGMAMTLADSAIPGESILLKCVAIDAVGDTVVVTPATFAGGATLTFDAVGEQVVLIWVTTTGWTARAGGTATVA